MIPADRYPRRVEDITGGAPWAKRDYELMAGPGAVRLAGSQNAFVLDGVGIIPITGPIFPRANMMTQMSGATSVSALNNDLRLALDSPDVGAIMLLLDSPGGAVSGINSLADAVAAGVKRKDIVAHVTGSAASAAYWIAASAKQITLERTGMVGSIGVVASMSKQVEPDANGEMSFEIVSTHAPNKRPDPASEDGRGEVVTLLDAIEKQFIADVARGRLTTVDKVISDFGQGGMKLGKDAVAAGMADRVQSQEATMTALRRVAANYKKLAGLRQA